MNPVLDAALEIQSFMQEREWEFCVVGGVAVQRWGQPRATQDVDVSLLTGFGSEERYIAELLAHFDSRRPNAAQFALVARVLVLAASNGVGVDIALAGIPFEEEAIARSSPFEFEPGARLRICSAEDLVVLKAFAGRPLDWQDVEGVLCRQFGKLDWAYIYEHLTALAAAKEEPGIVDELRALQRKVQND
jgi:hypothetical protein